jgi:hypothetical protein
MRSTLRTLLLLIAAALPACDDVRPEPAALAPSDSAARQEDPRAIYGATSAENVRVTPVEIEVADLPAGWNGMKIAALPTSSSASGQTTSAWPPPPCAARLAEKPDVVVLLGDYVARGDDYAALERVLAPAARHPVFAVLGHDDEDDDPDGKPDSTQIRTLQALQRNGVRVLRNARAPLAATATRRTSRGGALYARAPRVAPGGDLRRHPGRAAHPAAPGALPRHGPVGAKGQVRRRPDRPHLCGRMEVPAPPG